MRKIGTKTFQLKIPQDLQNDLSEIKSQKMINISEVLRKHLYDFVAEQKQKLKQSS